VTSVSEYRFRWSQRHNSGLCLMATYGLDLDTIHIVDDHPAVREALSSLLRASRKNVRPFTSGAEFLSVERDDTPACLILDLMISGFSLLLRTA
jgi:PleD family two-component response regulator